MNPKDINETVRTTMDREYRLANDRKICVHLKSCTYVIGTVPRANALMALDDIADTQNRDRKCLPCDGVRRREAISATKNHEARCWHTLWCDDVFERVSLAAAAASRWDGRTCMRVFARIMHSVTKPFWVIALNHEQTCVPYRSIDVHYLGRICFRRSRNIN